MNCLGTTKDIIGITSAIANKAWMDDASVFLDALNEKEREEWESTVDFDEYSLADEEGKVSKQVDALGLMLSEWSSSPQIIRYLVAEFNTSLDILGLTRDKALTMFESCDSLKDAAFLIGELITDAENKARSKSASYTGLSFSGRTREDIRHVCVLMYLLSKSRMKRDTVVYSGVRFNPNTIKDVGDVYELNVPMCTTSDFMVATMFGFVKGHSAGNSVYMEDDIDATANIYNYSKRNALEARQDAVHPWDNYEMDSEDDPYEDSHYANKPIESIEKSLHELMEAAKENDDRYIMCFKLKSGDRAVPLSGAVNTAYATSYPYESEYILSHGKYKVTKIDREHKYIELEPVRSGDIV